MNKTMCPGQDTRFWQPGDIFNSRCGNCGSIIEFFKDDASQRCKKCGTKVQNPKLNMGCAQWCEHARDCLGYDPKDQENAAAMSESVGFDVSIADRILGEIRLKFGENSELFNAASKYKEKAELLIDVQGGKPRIIIPAAMLNSAEEHGPGFKNRNDASSSGKAEYRGLTKGILKEAGLDNASIDEVIEIIDSIHNNSAMDSNEYRIVTSVVNSFQTQQ